MKTIKKILLDNFELLFLFSAIVFLYVKPDFANNYSFCVLHNFGFEHCPGCGLGESMHNAMHLNFNDSFSLHKLGIFAVAVIFFRIISLLISLIKDLKYGQNFTNDAGDRA